MVGQPVMRALIARLRRPARRRRKFPLLAASIPLLCGAICAGCDTPPPPPSNHAAITVASLVPAATDLIIGMGAKDQLVAVSNFDRDRADVKNLPKVGDYLSTDWERLAQLRPNVMIVQLDPNRIPAGLRQRAEEFHIRLLNIRINRLDDIFTALKAIGTALHDQSKAAKAADELHKRLDALRAAHAGKTPTRTLIVVGATGRTVAGRNNFLNDLLEIAGGTNVVPADMGPWPDIDPEFLIKLHPDAIVQLLPDPSPQQLEEAHHLWTQYPDLPAVRSHRVHVLTQWYLLQPGFHVALTAEAFSAALAR